MAKVKKKRNRRSEILINISEIDAIIDKAEKEQPLTGEECQKMRQIVEVLKAYFTPLWRNSEKTKNLEEEKNNEQTEKPEDVTTDSTASQENDSKKHGDPKKRRGHGRNGASSYTGANQVYVKHPELEKGATCPTCSKGKVYASKKGRPRVRLVGQPPVQGTVYCLEEFECNMCDAVFVAPEPEDIGSKKYDETVPAIIAQLKYGSGMTFQRIERLQQQFGIPLPATTQWDLVKDAADQIRPVLEELIKIAAEYPVNHIDDTGSKILELLRPEGDKRTGIYTTAFIATGIENDTPKISLFFSGAKHAGENLADVLSNRSADLGPPIHMSDAANCNASTLSKEAKEFWAHCMAHGRRQFVDIIDFFPEECRYVLEQLGVVYGNDKKAREQNMNSLERLAYHQEHSTEPMTDLHAWMLTQLEEKKTEPNSGLGKAIQYFLRRWERFTLFLRKPGVPLDNNIAERAIKRAVLHRKNALFYRTLEGASVGDLFMSLIHTCELNDVDSFSYLTELLRHVSEIKNKPADWLPWNYQNNLNSG